MKPIQTIRIPLMSLDIDTKELTYDVLERSDFWDVPYAGIVVKGVFVLNIACAFVDKFG